MYYVLKPLTRPKRLKIISVTPINNNNNNGSIIYVPITGTGRTKSDHCIGLKNNASATL